MSKIIAPASYDASLNSAGYAIKMDQIIRFNISGLRDGTATVKNAKEQIQGFFACHAWAVRPRWGFVTDLSERILNAEACLYHAAKSKTKKEDLVRLLDTARKTLR